MQENIRRKVPNAVRAGGGILARRSKTYYQETDTRPFLAQRVVTVHCSPRSIPGIWYLVVLLGYENGRSVTQTCVDNAHAASNYDGSNAQHYFTYLYTRYTSRISSMADRNSERESLPLRRLNPRFSCSRASSSPSCGGMMPDKGVWGMDKRRYNTLNKTPRIGCTRSILR